MVSSEKPVQMRFRAPRALFWVGFVVRVLCVLIGHTYHVRVRDDHWEFGYEAGRLARSLVTGHGYANPFNGVSGPSAWLPPLFPLIMAGAFKVFGVYTRASVIAVMVVDSVFSALIAPAVWEIGARCFDAGGFGRRKAAVGTMPVAAWSGWLWALYPAAIQYAIHWLWEMSLSTCLLAWAIVIALRLRRVGEGQADMGGGGEAGLSTAAAKGAAFGRDDKFFPKQWGVWCAFGLLWGAEALSNATLLIALPVTLVWILWSEFQRWLQPAAATPPFVKERQRMEHPLSLQPVIGAVLSCLLAFVVMVPWIVRNERVMHAFVPTRSNFGIEFWNATEWYHGALPWGSAVPLSPEDPEFKQFAQMGEVKYAKMRGVEAKANLRANPGEYVKDVALRTQFFWFIWPHPSDAKPVDETLRLLNYGFLSATGLMGLWVALRRRVPGAWMMAGVMMLVPLPYYLVTVQARFRHPIEPFLCVLTVFLFREARSGSDGRADA